MRWCLVSAYNTPSGETNPPELVAGCKGGCARWQKRDGGGRGEAVDLIPVKNATQVNPGEEIAARENRIFNASTRCARSSVRPSLIG